MVLDALKNDPAAGRLGRQKNPDFGNTISGFFVFLCYVTFTPIYPHIYTYLRFFVFRFLLFSFAMSLKDKDPPKADFED